MIYGKFIKFIKRVMETLKDAVKEMPVTVQQLDEDIK